MNAPTCVPVDPPRILIVTPTFYPAVRYGGPSRSVFELARGLARVGAQVRVFTTDGDGPGARLEVEPGAPVLLEPNLEVTYHRRLAGHSVSLGLLRALPASCRWADLVYIVAVYSFPTIPALFTCRVLGRPTVWAPKGALQPYGMQHRPWLKRLWVTVCRHVAPKSTQIQATSRQEAEDSSKLLSGFSSVVVPNPVSLPSSPIPYRDAPVHRIGFLGRIHPIKALDRLIQGCAKLNELGVSHWRLDIAGAGDDAYVDSLRMLAKDLGIQAQVRFLGFLDGEDKIRFFGDLDVLVLPSHTENFGLVVPEALAHGVPVVTSTGTPWEDLRGRPFGRWVPNDPSSLAEAIATLGTQSTAETRALARRYVEERFAAPAVAKSFLELCGLRVPLPDMQNAAASTSPPGSEEGTT